MKQDIQGEIQTLLQPTYNSTSAMKQEIQRRIRAFLQKAQTYSATSVEQSFDLNNFTRLIFPMIQQTKEIKSAENVVFLIGNTGTGKSTTINYLSGCQFYFTKSKTGRVYQTRSGSCQISASMGYRKFNSETLYPHLYHDNITNISYCDLPGLYDTRGLTHELAIAIGIDLAIKEVKSIQGFLITISYDMLTANKGILFKDFLNKLVDTIGNVDSIKKSLRFVFTRIDGETLSDNNYSETMDLLKLNLEEFLEHLQEQKLEPTHCDLIVIDSFSEEKFFKDLTEVNQFIYVLTEQGFYFLDTIEKTSKLLLNNKEHFEPLRKLKAVPKFMNCRQVCTDLSLDFDLILIKDYSGHTYCMDKRSEIVNEINRLNQTKILLEYIIKTNRFHYVDLNKIELSKTMVSDISGLEKYGDRTNFGSFLQGQLRAIFDIIINCTIVDGKDICQKRYELKDQFDQINQTNHSIKDYKPEKKYDGFFEILEKISQADATLKSNVSRLCHNRNNSCEVTIRNITKTGGNVTSIENRLGELTRKTDELKNNSNLAKYYLLKAYELKVYKLTNGLINWAFVEEGVSLVVSMFVFYKVGVSLTMHFLESRKKSVQNRENKNVKDAQQRAETAEATERDFKKALDTAKEIEDRNAKDLRHRMTAEETKGKDHEKAVDTVVKTKYPVETEVDRARKKLDDAKKVTENVNKELSEVEKRAIKNKEAAEKKFKNCKMMMVPLMGLIMAPTAILYLKSRKYIEEIRAESNRLNEEMECLKTALQQNTQSMTNQIEMLKLELLPSLMMKLYETLVFLQERIRTNNIDYTSNTDLFNLTSATENLLNHSLSSEFIAQYKNSKNVSQEQINSILIFKLEYYTNNTRHVEWLNLLWSNQTQNMKEKDNITSLMEKYVYPLGEGHNHSTEPGLKSNETNTGFCTMPSLRDIHHSDLTAISIAEDEQTTINAMRSSAIHGVIRGTSNVIAKAMKNPDVSDLTSVIVSEGVYGISMFVMNTVYYLQNNQQEETLPSAMFKSAIDTSILLFMNVFLNKAPDWAVRKAAQTHWKQSAGLFKQAANVIGYGLYAYNGLNKGVKAWGASLLTGTIAQKVVETVGDFALRK